MSPDIRSRGLTKPVDVAEYLFTRLHQIGIRSIHGVPGDFNLVALDYIPKAKLSWVGSVNELNAGYAADGYARVNGIGALVTTFGVGELSAVNAIAGCYAEQTAVIHIVGCPSTLSQRNGMLLHHTLGNGDFNVYANINTHISVDVAKLTKPSDIASQIDHAIRECVIRSRPVYIMLPTDMVQAKIEGGNLDRPVNLSGPQNDPKREDYVVDVIVKALHDAKSPIILVDACAVRHHALDEVHDLVDKTKLPTFVTPMGKGAINETLPAYGGVYCGNGSHADVAARVEASDLVLSIGSLKSDFNTAGFSYRTSQLNTIDLHSTHCTVGYSEYPGVAMRGVLRKIVERVHPCQLTCLRKPLADAGATMGSTDGRYPSSVITHEWLWPRIGKYLCEQDIVVTETGTANFGIWETKFPPGVLGLNQNLWGSIGWSVGAAQGAAMAAKDAGTDRRTILFVGDGSFQLTVQEVSTMIRRGLRITIFLLNNDGFTIERWIHGMEESYNDVASWNYTQIPAVFGATEKQVETFKASTRAELEKLLVNKAFNEARGMQLVEVRMPREDAPRALKITAEMAAQTNAKTE